MCVTESISMGRPDSVAKLAKNAIGEGRLCQNRRILILTQPRCMFNNILVKPEGRVSRRFRRYADFPQIKWIFRKSLAFKLKSRRLRGLRRGHPGDIPSD